MPEIKHSANKLGCFLLKGDFCFNFVPLIQFMANWQRFQTSHLSSILTSSPGFISPPDMMHHFPSAPSLTLRRRQINVLTWIHTCCMYTGERTGHPCLQRGCCWQPPRPKAHTGFQQQRLSMRGEVLGARSRQEGRWLLHHQRSRINLNRWTLQRRPANSTNGLFQKRRDVRVHAKARKHTHTRAHTLKSNQLSSFRALSR